MTLRSFYMSAQTKWMMTFTQIIAIWTPGISMQDHLKGVRYSKAWKMANFPTDALPLQP